MCFCWIRIINHWIWKVANWGIFSFLEMVISATNFVPSVLRVPRRQPHQHPCISNELHDGSASQSLFCIANTTICITPFGFCSLPEWSLATPVSVATKWTRTTVASRLAWSVTTFASVTTPSPAVETAGSSSLTVSVKTCVALALGLLWCLTSAL